LIQCACLVATKNGRLLLVRVRDNPHWYLPGGKIEPGESPEEALVRELGEELNISVRKDSLRYLYTVVGPAYGVPGEVSLVCFSAEWDGSIGPTGEISDVAWMGYDQTDKFAPAIRILIQEHLK